MKKDRRRGEMGRKFRSVRLRFSSRYMHIKSLLSLSFPTSLKSEGCERDPETRGQEQGKKRVRVAEEILRHEGKSKGRNE
eukprot:1394001-Amorphochlora_amoeboformis.AAC.2